MMNNPKTKLTRAKIAKETASSWSCENQYHKDNVNVAMGPRVGNVGRPEQNKEFQAAKRSREPLADMIVDAFAGRGRDDREKFKPGLEGISDDTRARFK